MADFPADIYTAVNPSPQSPRSGVTSPAAEVSGLNDEVKAIENTLGINLAHVTSLISVAVLTETSRAEAAEVALISGLSTETTRATTAEGLLAPKNSPALTGTPTAPTAATNTNTTQIATTAFVNNEISAAGAAAITTQSGTTYSPVLSDANTQIDFTNSASITVNVPDHSVVQFPKGTYINMAQMGTGTIIIQASNIATILTPAGSTSRTQYSIVSLINNDGANTWLLAGDLSQP